MLIPNVWNTFNILYFEDSVTGSILPVTDRRSTYDFSTSNLHVIPLGREEIRGFLLAPGVSPPLSTQLKTVSISKEPLWCNTLWCHIKGGLKSKINRVFFSVKTVYEAAPFSTSEA